MGMAVKGLAEHRLVRESVLTHLGTFILTPAERACCHRLVQRADLAIERIKQRKRNRATRQTQQRHGDEPV